MNDENQVETMEEGSELSEGLLDAINEDWDTDAAQYEQDRAQFLPRAEQEAAYQLSLLNAA